MQQFSPSAAKTIEIQGTTTDLVTVIDSMIADYYAANPS